MIKTYSELSKLKSFDERFKYLKLNGRVGKEVFGYDRYMNQVFYRSYRWKRVRDMVIARDDGCDLGIEGHEIRGEKIYIHHMNPLLLNDILDETEYLMNPEYLITTKHSTHNAIHYGDERVSSLSFVDRTINDTCPWKK